MLFSKKIPFHVAVRARVTPRFWVPHLRVSGKPEQRIANSRESRIVRIVSNSANSGEQWQIVVNSDK